MKIVTVLSWARRGLLAAVAAACVSCSFVTESSALVEAVDIALPAYTHAAALPPLAGWLVVTLEDGRESEQFVNANASSVSVTVFKNRVTPVLCYPLTAVHGEGSGGSETSAVRFFEPAGCVYPVSRRAAWKSGFEAKLAFNLLTRVEGGGDLGMSFNWKRLHDEIEKMPESFNPWNMSMEKFLTAVTGHSVTKSIIKEQKTIDVPVNGIEHGVFSQYVPNTAVSGENFAYCAARKNLVFDGAHVYLVCPPIRPGATGETSYSLALMPITLYTESVANF